MSSGNGNSRAGLQARPEPILRRVIIVGTTYHVTPASPRGAINLLTEDWWLAAVQEPAAEFSAFRRGSSIRILN